MARPGKDLIHFVTVVHSLMHDTAGWELCARYTHMAKCLLTDTEVNVLVGVGGVRRGGITYCSATRWRHSLPLQGQVGVVQESTNPK